MQHPEVESPSSLVTVHPVYMDSPYLFSHEAVVTSMGELEHKGKKLYWVRLDATIFHPQGGGQPGDQGSIDNHPITQAIKERLGSVSHFEINHCFDSPKLFQPGQTVKLNIQSERRLINMRMHSAGHLIAHLIERDFPYLKVIDGHHFPGEGRIRFEGEIPSGITTSFIEIALQKSLSEAIHDALSITQRIQEGTRVIQIGSFPAVPCGGTHIKTLEELGEVHIRYVKAEKQKISVGYEVSI